MPQGTEDDENEEGNEATTEDEPKAAMERVASGSSRALFPRGPSFTVDDFSSKDFIVRDFVDSLAETAIPANRRSGSSASAFDPKPLIRTFESEQAPTRPIPFSRRSVRGLDR